MEICSYPENMHSVLEACNEEEKHENDECVQLPKRFVEELREKLRNTIPRRASIEIRDNCWLIGKADDQEPHKYIDSQ